MSAGICYLWHTFQLYTQRLSWCFPMESILSFHGKGYTVTPALLFCLLKSAPGVLVCDHIWKWAYHRSNTLRRNLTWEGQVIYVLWLVTFQETMETGSQKEFRGMVGAVWPGLLEGQGNPRTNYSLISSEDHGHTDASILDVWPLVPSGNAFVVLRHLSSNSAMVSLAK